MAFVKRARKYDWRSSCTTDELARVAELEREREVIDNRLRVLLRELGLIRDRAISRIRYWQARGKGGQS